MNDRSLALSVIIATCGACGSEEAKRDPEFMDGTYASDWAPVPSDEPFAGKSLAEWGVAYMRWRFSPTSCDIPVYDQDGSMCGLYQDPDSPVVIFDYSVTNRLRTKCRIPAGKGIVVPIITFANDNLEVDPPKSEELLVKETLEVLETMRDLELRVDGNAVTDLDERRIEPTKHDYEIPPAPNWFSCTGTPGVEDMTVAPSFFAGYVAVFPPPEPGVHELQYAGVVSVDNESYALDTRTRFLVED
jgi:hypothetical protein